VCEKDLDALRQTCERAVEWADLIELRLDCLQEIPEKLPEFIARPLILTLRPTEQGGHRHLTREERQRFWSSTATRGERIWWDIEGDLVHDLTPDWSRVIVSHHDFSGVPSDLLDPSSTWRRTFWPAAKRRISIERSCTTGAWSPIWAHRRDRATRGVRESRELRPADHVGRVDPAQLRRQDGRHRGERDRDLPVTAAATPAPGAGRDGEHQGTGLIPFVAKPAAGRTIC